MRIGGSDADAKARNVERAVKNASRLREWIGRGNIQADC
jgi:hypothetical protein